MKQNLNYLKLDIDALKTIRTIFSKIQKGTCNIQVPYKTNY